MLPKRKLEKKLERGKEGERRKNQVTEKYMVGVKENKERTFVLCLLAVIK